MKQLIVLMAVLPIMALFLMQYSLEQRNSDQIERFCNYVYAAKEQAKQAGCFTNEIKSQLTEQLHKNLGIPKNEIRMDVTEIPKYRTATFDDRELIYYKISVPVNKLMVGNKLLGISDAENKGWYTVESNTASERLP